MPAMDGLTEPGAAELACLLHALCDRAVDELERIMDPRLRWTHASGKSETREDLLGAVRNYKVSYRRLEPEEVNCVAGLGFLLVEGIIYMEVEREGVLRTARSRFASFWEKGDTARLLHWQSTRLA